MPYLVRAQHLAHQRQRERLGYAHDGELVVHVAGHVLTPADAANTDAEQVARHKGQRRVVRGIGPLVVVLEARVGLIDQRLHHLRHGQAAGGYKVGAGGVWLQVCEDVHNCFSKLTGWGAIVDAIEPTDSNCPW